jgi:hypothetical protein
MPVRLVDELEPSDEDRFIQNSNVYINQLAIIPWSGLDGRRSETADRISGFVVDRPRDVNEPEAGDPIISTELGEQL